MEYCFTTNFDLLEIFKVVTPYLMGFIVFIIWFFQKGKEVFANESKEAIKDLLELSVINFSIVLEGSKSKTELETKLINFKETSERAHRAMLFINRKKDKKLELLLKNYFIYKESLYHSINNVVRNSDEMQIVQFLQLEATKQNTLRLDRCTNELISILYPYSIYKKFF